MRNNYKNMHSVYNWQCTWLNNLPSFLIQYNCLINIAGENWWFMHAWQEKCCRSQYNKKCVHFVFQLPGQTQGNFADHMYELPTSPTMTKSSQSCPSDPSGSRRYHGGRVRQSEPPSYYNENEVRVWAKERQKKDQHNQSKIFSLSSWNNKSGSRNFAKGWGSCRQVFKFTIISS